jgi:hypothetical protein
LYNRVFKNCQVNVGVPYQVKVPISYDLTCKHHDIPDAAAEPPQDGALRILEEAEHKARLIIEGAKTEAERILSELGRMGIETERMLSTGIVGHLEKKPGKKTVALRGYGRTSDPRNSESAVFVRKKGNHACMRS